MRWMIFVSQTHFYFHCFCTRLHIKSEIFSIYISEVAKWRSSNSHISVGSEASIVFPKKPSPFLTKFPFLQKGVDIVLGLRCFYRCRKYLFTEKYQCSNVVMFGLLSEKKYFFNKLGNSSVLLMETTIPLRFICPFNKLRFIFWHYYQCCQELFFWSLQLFFLD